MELKPCPFCGSAAKLKENQYLLADNNSKRFYIVCSFWECQIKQMWLVSKKEAIRMWNERIEKQNND